MGIIFVFLIKMKFYCYGFSPRVLEAVLEAVGQKPNAVP